MKGNLKFLNTKVSFSKEMKDAIAAEEIKNGCCRRALLSGFLAAGARAGEHDIIAPAPSDAVFSGLQALIHEVYSTDTELKAREKGGRGRLLSFKSVSAYKFISKITTDTQFTELFKPKCQGCRAAFLRGAFLAAGRISDPEKQFSLEFSFGERAMLFKRIFTDLSVEPRVTVRGGSTVLYYRSGSQIEDFLALAGINDAVFEVINAMINKESRNMANRISNCETNNIGKSIDAARKYINAIEDLEEAKLLSSLPDELERTARLRLEYSDLSLFQLSKVAVPPISKSGLSHRLNKILEHAERKLSKKY